jgi:hypothetical protein
VPLAVVSVVLFVVLPIVIATPLVIWLARQMDGWRTWWKGSLTRTESGLRLEQWGAGREVIEEPVVSLPSATGLQNAETPSDPIAHAFAQAPIRRELAAVDRQ